MLGLARRPRHVLKWVGLALFLLVVAGAVGHLCSSSPGARLRRAARAVTAPDSARKGQVVLNVGGHTVAVPLGVQLDRHRAVSLALESERLRRQAVRALGQASAWSTSAEERGRRAIEVSATFIVARQRLAEFLKVGLSSAEVILYALGWPWFEGSHPHQSVQKFVSVDSAWPGVLAGMSAERRREIVEAVDHEPAWPVARQMLKARFGMADAEAAAVRGHLCRRGTEAAFGSFLGFRRGVDALGKYADLSVVQAEAVLAMAGALALTRAGEAALPYVERMGRRDPGLADLVRREVIGDAEGGMGPLDEPPTSQAGREEADDR